MEKHENRLLADCHLHFEGSLPREFLARLAGRAGHAFRDLAVFEERRRGVRDAAGFLLLFAEVCRLFRRPEDYAEAARARRGARRRRRGVRRDLRVSGDLHPHGAPAGGVPGRDRRGVPGAAGRLRLPDPPRRRPPLGPRVGRARALAPREDPLRVRRRVRDGGRRSVRAGGGVLRRLRARPGARPEDIRARGEWAGPDSITAALDALRPDRVDHGIAAAADPKLCERLAGERTTLCVAPSGNVATGAVEEPETIL